jgi:UDP-N-acetylmuramoyl-tripeptide--D-alanyl-D-alanine ligase
MTVRLCDKPSQARETAALMTLGEAASLMGTSCASQLQSTLLARVTTDSRNDCAGALFIALEGEKYNGHDYVADALDKGAVAAVVSRSFSSPDKEHALLKVENTLEALADLAAAYRRRLSIPVVAITGSCGKTTTKEFLAAALSPKYCVAKPKASFNNLIGVSLTILGVRPEHDLLILEMGTNAPGEIEALCRIGDPTMGILTNVGHTHLEKLGSIEGVKKEKASLAEYIGEGGVLVTNMDCPQCGEIAEKFRGQVVTVAARQEADHHVQVETQTASELSFRYDTITTTVPAPGEHNALNAGLATATAEVLGVEKEEALSAISTAQLPGMRMQGELVGGVLVINDAYNSNFESLKAAVAMLDKATISGRKILVCGDMLELGRAAEALHKAIGWHVGRTSIEILVTVGANSELVATEAHNAGTPVVFQRTSVSEVGKLLEWLVRRGDAVLFKASRGVRLERAVQRLRYALMAKQDKGKK